MTASRIPGLDALRGLAALLVLIFHLRGFVLPMAVLGHGYLAVDLFFVISGFVLARAYDAELMVGQGAAFMIKRLKRLYPMAVLGLLLGATIWLATGTDPAATLLVLAMGLVFLPVTSSRDAFPLNGPQWSLMWELLANLVYAVVAPWLTTRRLVVLLAASGGVHAILALKAGTGSLGPYGHDGWSAAPRVLYGFFAGVLLARGGLKLPAAPIAAILAAVVLVLAAPVPEAGRAVFDLAAALAVLPLLVAVAARAEVAGRLRLILDGLAGLSYALYALHIPIVLGLAGVARQMAEGWGRDSVQLLAVPLALGAAWAAHRWFEPWAATLLKKRPQGFSTSAPSSSTR